MSEIEDEKSSSSNSLIGQFGVGFYSTFMVADKVKVNSRSFETGSQGYTWSSDGSVQCVPIETTSYYFAHRSGLYEISEASHETRGTKIVVQLKADELRFADRDTVEGKDNEKRVESSHSQYTFRHSEEILQLRWFSNISQRRANQYNSTAMDARSQGDNDKTTRGRSPPL